MYRLALVVILTLGGMASVAADFSVRDLGIPVRGVNWVGLMPGVDGEGKACLYIKMGQQAANLFVLQVDPETGKFTEHLAPGDKSNYPTAALWGPDNRLYIGAAYSGLLLRFDPKLGRFENLGRPDPSDEFPCRIAAGPDGALWIGAYPGATLTRFDPKTGEYTRYGRADQVDMYSYPQVGADGTVATLVKMTRPHVVALDKATGKLVPVGPVVTAGESGQSLDFQRGADGMLYIVSSEGNFRLHGTQLEPVQSVPSVAPPPTLPGGVTFSFADAAEQVYRQLALKDPSGHERRYRLDYDAAGSDVFYVHLGPDGKIYGSSVLPLHLFRYDPTNGEVVDLGRCSGATGEAYSMGNLDGKLYICSYGGGYLSVYDPTRPYHFGAAPENNPRDLGVMHEFSLRPRAMITGPLGRVWTGSYPNYGTWGGPLAWYDPATGKFGGYRPILEDQSVVSLAWDASTRLIVGGSSIGGGSGTHAKATEAALFLWDPVKEEMVWHAAPRLKTTGISSLLAGRDGLIYGIAEGWLGDRGFSEIFLFDPRRREFIRHFPVPAGSPLDNSLQVGDDGRIYGLTRDVFYRLTDGGSGTQVLARLPGEFNIGGPLVGRTLYFATGHKLRALTLND